MPHALFVMKIKNNNVAIFDQYISKSECKDVSYDFIEKNTLRVIYFYKKQEHGGQDISSLIADSINAWKKEGFEQFYKFQEDMIKTLNIAWEVADDPLSSKLVMNMKSLADDRVNFVEAIELFEEKFQVELNIAKDLLFDISRIYEKLRAYIIKCAFMRCIHKTDIIESELKHILDRENAILNELKALL